MAEHHDAQHCHVRSWSEPKVGVPSQPNLMYPEWSMRQEVILQGQDGDLLYGWDSQPKSSSQEPKSPSLLLSYSIARLS